MNPPKTRQWFSAPDARITLKRKTFADGKESPIVTLTGYPIVWDAQSTDRGGYTVKLAKGSATFTQPAMALWHHDFSKPLASTANGTLRVLQADDYGVPVEIDLDTRTSAGKDAAAYVSPIGDTPPLVAGMSFSMANGFEDYSEDGPPDARVLTAKKYTVDEVTITAIPAFKQSQIGLKPESDDQIPPAEMQPGGMSDRSRDAPETFEAANRNRLATMRLAQARL